MNSSRVISTPKTLILGTLLFLFSCSSLLVSATGPKPIAELPTISAPSYPNSDQSSSISNSYHNQRLIIKTTSANTLPQVENSTNTYQLTSNLYIIEYPSESATAEAHTTLQNNPAIATVAIDKDVYIQTDSLSQSTEPERIIHIQEASEGYEAWGVAATGLDKYRYAMNQNSPKETVKVAVIDTGINSAHEVFINSAKESSIDFTGSYNYIASSTNVEDDNGHGTMAAGTIIESSSDNVKVVPLKVMDAYGRGSLSNTMRAIKDIYPSVDIINLSLGLPDVDPTNSNAITESEREVFESLLNEVTTSGTIVVAAAGNEKSAVSYPASSSYTFAASSVNRQKEFSSNFSNFGPQVDFATPGQEVIVPCFHAALDPITAYCVSNGTSISSPFLAAAFAMVKTEFPNYNVSEITNFIQKNAEDLGTPGKDDYYGYGCVDFNLDRFYAPAVTVTDKTYTSTVSNGVEITQNTVTNTLTVTSTKPCTVIANQDDTYTSLPAAPTSLAYTYTFTYDPYTASNLIVALKGDVNLDARISLSDSNLIVRSLLSPTHFAYRNLNNRETAISDLNRDSKISLSDSNLIVRSLLSPTHFAYRRLSW